ncbi:MAG: single-stranded DNA-binding protein [Pseudanabaenaceae cyanobacterium]
MNSIVLLAEVLTEPELRYTPDNQSAIASFLVQFPANRPEESPYRIRVVGWNNLANDIMERKYQRGVRVLIEGRLRCDTVERNGRKEKVTEIVAARVYDLSAGMAVGTKPSMPASYKNPTPPKPEPINDDVPF